MKSRSLRILRVHGLSLPRLKNPCGRWPVAFSDQGRTGVFRFGVYTLTATQNNPGPAGLCFGGGFTTGMPVQASMP